MWPFLGNVEKNNQARFGRFGMLKWSKYGIMLVQIWCVNMCVFLVQSCTKYICECVVIAIWFLGVGCKYCTIQMQVRKVCTSLGNTCKKYCFLSKALPLIHDSTLKQIRGHAPPVPPCNIATCAWPSVFGWPKVRDLRGCTKRSAYGDGLWKQELYSIIFSYLIYI